MGYKAIVVGTDGSESAERAVRHAGRLAATFGSRLVIVTAFTRHHDHDRQAERVPDELRWAITDRHQAEEKAKAGRHAAHDEGAKDIVIVADEGDPAEKIIEAAEDHNADLIVVGSKGLTSASRFLLGSVANTVSHHAPCDVLIAHTV
jgi:nucleotide-binding universal stress UspA family protein